MKCAEVVEWMHRYVDHDLNDEETSLLFEHIRECSDCAEEFELLNELSAKLSELPDVTPRFSLVDRIMPQLDEIDRARLEEGSAVENDGILGSVAAQAAASSSSMRSRSNSKAAQRSRSRRFRTGIFGTVAAAVILGIFITQYEPRTIPNAELSTANQSAESLNQPSSGNEFSTRSLEEAENQASSGAAGNSGALQDAIPGSTGEMNSLNRDGQPSSAGDSAPEKKGSSGNDGGKQDSSPDAKANSFMGFSGDDGRPAADHSGGAESRSTERNGAVEEDPAAGSPANNGDAGDHRMEMAPLAPDMQVSSPDGQAPANHYGIAAMPEEWDSPDGTHRAVLMGSHLFIYQVNNEEHVLIKDEEVTGTWLKGEWSSDGTKFTYEADVDGSVAKHTVQAKPAVNAENSSQNK
ncbi:hypothetical protein YSY43_28230 [Paenibacillus sp. YSY-4.3]